MYVYDSEQIRAIIWDMGGVLVSTDEPARRKLASRFDMTFEELEQLIFRSDTALRAEVGTLTKAAHWDNVGRRLCLEASALEEFERAFWDAEKQNEELLSFVNSLRPMYMLGLLSNGWANARDRVTQQFGFLGLFHASVFSGEVGIAKPDARAYRLILRQLGVSSRQAIFIDDNRANVDGAKTVGLHTIHYESNEQLFAAFRRLHQV
jgi:putative hydrolase of the HAD superfamily